MISVFPSNITPPATASIVPGEVLALPNGKILVVGAVGLIPGVDIALVRYLADGSLDTTFGTGGFVNSNLGAYYSDEQTAHTALLLPSGKILVGGTVKNKFAVVRFNEDGTHDTTFGNSSGVAFHNDMYTDYGVQALAVMSDGRILAAGSGTAPSGSKDFVVMCFSASGVLDSSFGSSGRAFADFGSAPDTLTGMALSSSGRIVCVGYTDPPTTDYVVATACFTSSGALDTAFSGDGKDTQAVGTSGTFAEDVAVLADGKILVAGTASPSPQTTNMDFMLLKYHVNGTLDTTFGGAGTGIAIADFGALSVTDGLMEDRCQGVLVQPDGKILVTGYVGEVSQNSTDTRYAVARHHADGTLDATFGLNGVAAGQVDAYKDYGYASALQPDGKIVVAGLSRNSGGFDRIGVARFWGHTPVQTWRLRHFGSIAATGNAADSADPDSDGSNNLLEYALGTSPVGVQTTSALALTVERVGIRNYATATITKPHGEEGLSYNMTVSGNMSQWFTDGLYTTVLVDDATTFKIRDNTYLTGNVPRFARIVVGWLVP